MDNVENRCDEGDGDDEMAVMEEQIGGPATLKPLSRMVNMYPNELIYI